MRILILAVYFTYEELEIRKKRIVYQYMEILLVSVQTAFIF